MEKYSKKILDNIRIVLKDPDAQDCVRVNVRITLSRLMKTFHETLINYFMLLNYLQMVY